MACPFCLDEKYSETSHPANNFNNKLFHYVRCKQCSLVYLVPFPDGSDYIAMYPPSYQGNQAETSIQDDPYVKLGGLRFTYGYQFDKIRKLIGNTARILDYGCGTGHFLGNAVHYGFDCDGAEFSSEYVETLQKSFNKSSFFTIDKVLADEFPEKYDVIRLSNVLEHLDQPRQIIARLEKLLNPGGLILVEGPIEDNFSIAELFRKIYFRIGKLFFPARTVSSPPYHIFFSNAKNQLQFFRNCKFETIHFATSEDSWPFPASLKEAMGIAQKISAIVAKFSIKATKIRGGKWGNIFIYIGRAKS